MAQCWLAVVLILFIRNVLTQDYFLLRVFLESEQLAGLSVGKSLQLTSLVKLIKLKPEDFPSREFSHYSLNLTTNEPTLSPNWNKLPVFCRLVIGRLACQLPLNSENSLGNWLNFQLWKKSNFRINFSKLNFLNRKIVSS